MTKASGTYSSTTANATAAKAMMQPISVFLNAALARTGDTGQVTWSTYATLANGYEVFAFTDAMQANYPIYVRVDYAVGNNGYLSFTVGTATTGAGVITGVLQTSMPIDTGRSATGVTRYWYGSSDGSYLALAMNMQATATSTASTQDSLAAIVIERTRDADGTPNGAGLDIWRWYSTADALTTPANGSFDALRCKYYDSTATQPAAQYDYGVQPQNLLNVTSYAAANNTYLFPALTQAGPVLGGASKALALAASADVPKQSAFTVTHYGAATTWIAMGNAQLATVPYMSAAATAAVKTGFTPCFRWD
jgi:hypothetical protein